MMTNEQIKAKMLEMSNNYNWDYRFMASSVSVPPDALKFGLKVIDTSPSGQRTSKKKWHDFLIPFQFVEEFPTWTKAANWNSVSDIQGRFEDISVYSNSSAVEQSMIIVYQVESDSEDSNTYWTLKNVNKITRRIQSLVFPQNDSYFSPPFKALLNIGRMYIDFPVIIKQITMPHEAPYYWKTGETLTRKITIEMRSSYPLWQGINAESVWNSSEETGGSIKCFARKEYKKKSYNY